MFFKSEDDTEVFSTGETDNISSCQGELGGTAVDILGLKSPSLSWHHFLFGLVPLVKFLTSICMYPGIIC